MQTKRTKVEGTCYIWALPKSDWQIEQDIEEHGVENVIPFRYVITANSAHYQTGAVKVHEFDVLGTVPEGVDLIKAAVKTMREEIAEIQKEAAKKVADLEEQIKHLALITYQPDVVDVSPAE